MNNKNKCKKRPNCHLGFRQWPFNEGCASANKPGSLVMTVANNRALWLGNDGGLSQVGRVGLRVQWYFWMGFYMRI